MSPLPAILAVAGSDSSAGAGVQADIKSIAANGGYGLTAVTAVTAQHALGVTACMPVDPDVVTAQIAAAFEAFEIAAVKTGMLADRKRVTAVAGAFRTRGAPHYVLDPVLATSSGHPLLEPDAVGALLDELAPLAELVTPNVPEAELLSGRAVRTPGDARHAARTLIERGCRAVLVKGGHLEGAPATDLLVTPDIEHSFAGQFVPTSGASGTGCSLSAAIATHLARGETLIDAIGRAKRYITDSIRHGPAVGRGAGPMDHFHAQRASRNDPARTGGTAALPPGARGRRQGATPRDSRTTTIPRLHVITDETLQARFSHGEIARQALAGGADCVQFREKRPMTTVDLIGAARPVVNACRAAGALAVIDDRADVALALDADAVHLGRHDLEPAAARRLLGARAIIGGTANSYDEAARVWQTDVDYLGVGPVYGTRSKADPAPDMGLDTLARIAADSPKPVIAIGGIGPQHIDDILRAGAYGVAVLSCIAAAGDPREAARDCAAALADALRSARA